MSVIFHVPFILCPVTESTVLKYVTLFYFSWQQKLTPIKQYMYILYMYRTVYRALLLDLNK